jgi:hypothetical protein
MQFKKDDDVIVRLKDRSSRIGKFIEEKYGRFLIDFHHSTYLADKIDVRRFTPIDDEVTDEWCKQQAPEIVATIKKCMSTMFPTYKFQLKTEDGSIEMDGVSLMPSTLRVESISGVLEVPGFQLVDWKYYPATRSEPEDAVEIPISEHRNAASAALALIKLSIGNHLDHWFQSEDEQKLAE